MAKKSKHIFQKKCFLGENGQRIDNLFHERHILNAGIFGIREADHEGLRSNASGCARTSQETPLEESHAL